MKNRNGSNPPPIGGDDEQMTWAHALIGRRPFVAIAMELGEGNPIQSASTPHSQVFLSGFVGTDRYEIKLDKLYDKPIFDQRRAEMLEVIDLYVAQINKSTAEISPCMDEDFVASPASQYRDWLMALEGRKVGVYNNLRFGEAPSNQRRPTPDVLRLDGRIGGEVFAISLDKHYDAKTKSNLKGQMLSILAAFRAKVLASISF